MLKDRNDVAVVCSSVGEDFAVLVCQLVRAGLEYLGDYVQSFPWGRELVAAPVVLSKPQHQVPFVEVSAPGPLRLVPSQGLLVVRRVEERHVSSLVHLVQRVFASSLVSLLLICLEPWRSVFQVSGE